MPDANRHGKLRKSDPEPKLVPDPQHKFAWHEQVWTGPPLARVAFGGGIGGGFGGAACVVHQQVFRRTKHPILRYVLTGLISLAAILGYLVLARLLVSTFRPQQA